MKKLVETMWGIKISNYNCFAPRCFRITQKEAIVQREYETGRKWKNLQVMGESVVKVKVEEV
jgi:hypothetical protein